MTIHDYLKDNILLFDGSMGTYVLEKIPSNTAACEFLNITHPDEILNIHTEYVNAGAKAVKTNTFSVNRQNFSCEDCVKIITEGFKTAQKSHAEYVFCDIGPITCTDSESLFEEYRFIADIFLSLGAKYFLFETHSRIDSLCEISEYIKSVCPDSYIILSFAPQPDGFTRSGNHISNLIAAADACLYVDSVGLNCISGARHMVELVRNLPSITKNISIMPNVGYPTVLGNRTYYNGNSSYFASQMQQLAALGVKILGGCCGTTPEHIAATADVLKFPFKKDLPQKTVEFSQKSIPNIFWDKLCSTKKAIAVELDPPENSDVVRFIEGARLLQAHGADIITIADCPIARARMDSSILACKITRELNMPALPHLTCRDRNLNATKALLLGLCAEGVHNVLTVTGDPISSSDRDEVKSVYNFNSRMLASYITALGETALPTPFRIFGALNINAQNFSVQLRIAKEKLAGGMCGFFTQPVLTQKGLDNLILARQELDCKILGGIMPVVSHRNALFMNSEVNGIEVDEKIISMYKGLNREEGEDLAVKISTEIADKISPYVDGYYLITPFNRAHLIARIIEKIL